MTNGAKNTPSASASATVSPSSASAARSPPNPSNKVKALAERFERSPGATSPTASSALRSRSRDPSRAVSYDVHRRANASVSSTASAARPSKEASYGPHKFSNLKPRDRPQPAPATPRNPRRTNGTKTTTETQGSSAKTKTPSQRRPSTSGGRQLFGEVLTGQDASSPGFGIPTTESTLGEAPLPSTSTHTSRHGRSASGPTTGVSLHDTHRAQPHDHTKSRSPPRQTPRSRIPIATRRRSIGSNSNSSTRSVKYTPTRSVSHSNRNSPTRMDRVLAGATSTSRGADQSTLPALAYRGYRERGKSPLGVRPGPSVAAVVTAPPPPTSPRLRNSRERQPLQPSPASRSRSTDRHDEHGYFPLASSFQLQPEQSEGLPGVAELEQSFEAHAQAKRPSQDQGVSPSDQQHLSLQTSSLAVPPSAQPQSAVSEFDESPVLGLPGSFVLTPPTTHQNPDQQLLQPNVFHASGRFARQ